MEIYLYADQSQRDFVGSCQGTDLCADINGRLKCTRQANTLNLDSSLGEWERNLLLISRKSFLNGKGCHATLQIIPGSNTLPVLTSYLDHRSRTPGCH
jgi:hypothetical protein